MGDQLKKANSVDHTAGRSEVVHKKSSGISAGQFIDNRYKFSLQLNKHSNGEFESRAIKQKYSRKHENNNSQSKKTTQFQNAINSSRIPVQKVDGEENAPRDGFLTRVIKGFKKHGTWMMLIAEGLGHWTISLATAFSAAGGAIWNIITSVCQGIIGASKMARAYFVRKIAYNPLSALPSYFNKLIAGEGVLGAIAAVAGGWGVLDKGKDLVVNVLPKISSFLGSVIKIYRGGNGANLSKRQKGGLIMLESIFGIFGNIERIFKATGDVFDGAAKTVSAVASKFVGSVKLARGAKTFAEGAVASSESETQEEQNARLRHILATEDLDPHTRGAILARLRDQGAVALPSAHEAAEAARARGLAHDD